MEWMFLSCHNYWIVCRLVRRDGGEPFLAYSPCCSIENSSEQFRAFLGAILSVKNGVPVETSAFDPELKLDNISEEMGYAPSPEEDIVSSSGKRGPADVSSMVPTIPSRAITRGQAEEPAGLMVRPILDIFLSVGSLVYSQINYFLLPALP
jgi:hypothetical protein